MTITQKEYCGHWDDDALKRTLGLKIAQADQRRRELRNLEDEMLYIQTEQRDRLSARAT